MPLHKQLPADGLCHSYTAPSKYPTHMHFVVQCTFGEKTQQRSRIQRACSEAYCVHSAEQRVQSACQAYVIQFFKPVSHHERSFPGSELSNTHSARPGRPQKFPVDRTATVMQNTIIRISAAKYAASVWNELLHAIVTDPTIP